MTEMTEMYSDIKQINSNLNEMIITHVCWHNSQLCISQMVMISTLNTFCGVTLQPISVTFMSAVASLRKVLPLMYIPQLEC